jgi:hypothetical protein
MFLEAAGQAFADGHHLSVVVARLGWCPRTRADVVELGGTGWGQDVYLSPGDAGRFFACAATAPADIRYAVVYACSQPVGEAQYDLEPAKRLLGFEPQDRWPQGIEVVVGPGGLDSLGRV